VWLIERASRWLDETVADGRLRAGWSLPVDGALVLGSSQRLEDFHSPADLPLVRRGTGGGAVICDGSYLMLDIVLPAGDSRIEDDLAESYRWLADRLLVALRATGVDELRAVPPLEARAVDERARRAGRLACWAGLGPYELVDARGRKVVGLAQRRRRGAALFQAAGYLGGTRDRLADLLPADEVARADVRARLGNVASLGELAPRFAASPPKLW
jgi:lipoate---protein ligase